MVYPDVRAGTQIAAVAVASAVGIAVGAGVHALLRSLRQRGPIGAVFARWWAWFAGLVAAMAVAVGIAGPFVLARMSHNISPSPLTAREIFVTTGFLSLGYAALIPVFRRGD